MWQTVPERRTGSSERSVGRQQSDDECAARRAAVVNIIGLINEVNQHRARLVLGWMTVFGRVNHLGM